MSRKTTQAATQAAARVVTLRRLYRICLAKSTVINEALAELLFGLESPHLSPTERIGILDVIDGLIRLKIDAGLLKGRRR